MAGYTLREAHPQEPVKGRPFQEWAFPDGTPWTRFWRTREGYLLRFPELADFEISGNALKVTCHPAPDVPRSTCDHIYLNQVLPLVLSRQGRQVFHASAVEIGEGAVAFLGESGRGKSTLAASFASSGTRFLTDDGLSVEAGGEGFRVLPGHPSIRLWQDSREALLSPVSSSAPPLVYTSKARMLAGTGLAFCEVARPLKLAFFLGAGNTRKVVVEPLAAAQALVEWIRHSFLLDPEEKSLLASHFDRVAALADRVRCFRLDYPRRYGALGRVRQAIVRQLHEKDVVA